MKVFKWSVIVLVFLAYAVCFAEEAIEQEQAAQEQAAQEQAAQEQAAQSNWRFTPALSDSYAGGQLQLRF